MSKLITKTNLLFATYFITGTDTDVGKTICTKALLQAANKQSLRTLAYKPISAGCEETNEGLRNQDALILQQHSSITVDYDNVNPIAFKEPIAPHIAALKTQQVISVDIINKGLTVLQNKQPQLLLVEGAGGWHLPVSNEQLLSDWVVEKQLPVILIVGLKLGCLNHALLTAQTIQQSGLYIAGWIANHLQPDMPYVQDNISTLNSLIKAPLIAEIPFLENINKQDLSSYIEVEFTR